MSSDPCDPVTLHSPDGATLTVSAYGGQILGWAPEPGDQRLYLSPASRCGGGQAIRGGVPVIFPQFSARGPLRKHGLVRDRPWQGQEIPDPLGAAWRARIASDDATLAVWPAHFTAQITARATAHQLEIALQLTNTGDQPWSFAAALHTYFVITDQQASISGLSGHATEQNAQPGRIDPAQPGDTGDTVADWPALEPRDVRVLDVTGPVTLNDPGRSGLVITAEGFPDRVVWNPGAGSGIGDIPDGDERGFVCVEPAVVAPHELAPGQSWTGRQMFSIGHRGEGRNSDSRVALD